MSDYQDNIEEERFCAVIDESFDSKSGEFILGGHIATYQNWISLTEEWRFQLTRIPSLEPSTDSVFKMSSMAKSENRMQEVPGFFRIIEKYVTCSISCRINSNDLRNAISRIYAPYTEIDFGHFRNPYLFCWRALMDMFHSKLDTLSDVVPKGAKVDFLFDGLNEQQVILDSWDEYLQGRPSSLKNYFGNRPEFRNDKDFLPVQTADFWAWWVRKWYISRSKGQQVKLLNFESWQAIREDHPIIIIEFNEAEILTSLIELAHQTLGPERTVYYMAYPYWNGESL